MRILALARLSHRTHVLLVFVAGVSVAGGARIAIGESGIARNLVVVGAPPAWVGVSVGIVLEAV